MILTKLIQFALVLAGVAAVTAASDTTNAKRNAEPAPGWADGFGWSYDGKRAADPAPGWADGFGWSYDGKRAADPAPGWADGFGWSYDGKRAADPAPGWPESGFSWTYPPREV